jgi:hypothetical protein
MTYINTRAREIVFVVSTGRTATKAIAHYFSSAYDHSAAFHEPFPSRVLRVASNLHLCGRIGRKSIGTILAFCRRRLLEGAHCDIYLEANPFLHGCLDVFDDVFGRVKVVHIVRHPGDYITSYVNFGVFRGVKGFATNYFPYWMIKPDQYEDVPKKRWREMGEHEKIAWRWRSINTVLDRGEQLFPYRYMRIKFEELFANDASGLGQIAEWLGLPSEPIRSLESIKRKIHASHNRGFSQWRNWDPEIRGLVQGHCQPLMDKYGYTFDE